MEDKKERMVIIKLDCQILEGKRERMVIAKLDWLGLEALWVKSHCWVGDKNSNSSRLKFEWLIRICVVSF